MKDNQGVMLVYAARYAHDRDTFAANQIVTHIIRVWDEIPAMNQETLKREAMIATKNRKDWRKLKTLECGDS